MIILNIAALDAFLHLRNRLTPAEYEFIGEQIIDEFGNILTFADINLFFRRVKSGLYGEFYERISAPTLLTWLRQYVSDRLDTAESVNYNTDKQNYGIASNNNILTSLGYTVEDGKVHLKPKPLNVEQKKAPIRKTRERNLDDINRSNKVMELSHQLLRENPGIGWLSAVDMAVKQIDNEKPDSNENQQQ